MQNLMEELARDALMNEARNNARSYAGICGCGQCMAYVLATALNRLTPCYVNDAGDVYGNHDSDEMSSAEDVADAVRGALQSLMQNPRHT